jgi:hypothetical protein
VEANIKVTYANDVVVAAQLLSRRLGDDPHSGTR